MGEDLKLLEQKEHELRIILGQIKAIRDRIEVEKWKNTKSLLSIAFTEIKTGQLYLKEAIEEQKRVPSPRYGN